MGRNILMELVELSHAIDIVKRHIFPDTPFNQEIEREVLVEVNKILNYYLNIDPTYLEPDSIESLDYYDECIESFINIPRRRDWILIKTNISVLSKLEVLDSYGCVLLVMVKK